jgi:hypothetical protein
MVKRLGKKAFGPWEEREFPSNHPLRPQFPSDRGERWRPVAFLNNKYAVQISDVQTEWGEVIHLWVRRHDDKQPHCWRELQRIKNELVGKERLAVEVFPAKSKLVDSANMAHLWVLPEGFDLPFTLHGLPDGD